MADKQSERGVLLVDFINEIVDPAGKLAGKGYAKFVEEYGTMDRVRSLLESARAASLPIFHVAVGFSADYKEQPEQSPLFGGAKKFGALKIGTWATEFHQMATPLPREAVMQKHRVSAFFGTPLDLVLRTCGVRELYIGGVATDMAVQAAARDAHDRDFIVTVIEDCCAAASEADHKEALRLLTKVSAVKQLGELRFTHE